MTLVLDTSDNTLGPPVNRGGESGYVDLERRLGDGDVNVLQTLEKAVEFLVGEISELVEANSESDISTRVELSDPVVVILPDGVPGLEFIGRINLVVFPHPFGEARLEVLLVAQRGTYEEGEEEESDERAHLMSVSVCGVQKTKTERLLKTPCTELISRSLLRLVLNEGRQNRSVRVLLRHLLLCKVGEICLALFSASAFFDPTPMFLQRNMLCRSLFFCGLSKERHSSW